MADRDMSFQEIQQIGGAPSELTQRQADKQAQVKEFESIPSYLEGEQRKARQQAQLQEVRDVSRSTAELAKQRELNFDEGLRNQRRLAKLDSQVSRQLLDEELKFKEDSAGRKLLSERQLMDWYATRAKSEEDWANFEARSNQIHTRKIQFLEAAYKKLETEEAKLYKVFKSNLDRDTQKYLAERKAALKAEIAKAKVKAANQSALSAGLSTVGTIGGQALGTAIGGPVGGMVGGAAGGMLGTRLGETVAD